MGKGENLIDLVDELNATPQLGTTQVYSFKLRKTFFPEGMGDTHRHDFTVKVPTDVVHVGIEVHEYDGPKRWVHGGGEARFDGGGPGKPKSQVVSLHATCTWKKTIPNKRLEALITLILRRHQATGDAPPKTLGKPDGVG